jgi:hypothetical protein
MLGVGCLGLVLDDAVRFVMDAGEVAEFAQQPRTHDWELLYHNDWFVIVYELVDGQIRVDLRGPCGQHTIWLPGEYPIVRIVRDTLVLVCLEQLITYWLSPCADTHSPQQVVPTVSSHCIVRMNVVDSKSGSLVVVERQGATEDDEEGQLYVRRCMLTAQGRLEWNEYSLYIMNEPHIITNVFANDKLVLVTGYLYYDAVGIYIGKVNLYIGSEWTDFEYGDMVDSVMSVDGVLLILYQDAFYNFCMEARLDTFKKLWKLQPLPQSNFGTVKHVSRGLVLVVSERLEHMVLVDVHRGQIVWKYGIAQVLAGLGYTETMAGPPCIDSNKLVLCQYTNDDSSVVAKVLRF